MLAKRVLFASMHHRPTTYVIRTRNSHVAPLHRHSMHASSRLYCAACAMCRSVNVVCLASNNACTREIIQSSTSGITRRSTQHLLPLLSHPWYTAFPAVLSKRRSVLTPTQRSARLGKVRRTESRTLSRPDRGSIAGGDSREGSLGECQQDVDAELSRDSPSPSREYDADAALESSMSSSGPGSRKLSAKPCPTSPVMPADTAPASCPRQPLGCIAIPAPWAQGVCAAPLCPPPPVPTSLCRSSQRGDRLLGAHPHLDDSAAPASPFGCCRAGLRE